MRDSGSKAISSGSVSGSASVSTLVASVGRALIVVAIGLGVGTIPFVVSMVLPLFVILFLMFEVSAASVYIVSGSLLLIAIVESLWFARTVALSWPITFKF